MTVNRCGLERWGSGKVQEETDGRGWSAAEGDAQVTEGKHGKKLLTKYKPKTLKQN